MMFSHGSANSWSLGSHPFLAGVFIHLKVLPLWLLVGQSRFPQSSPDCVFRNVDLILFLNNPVQSTNRPKIGFVSVRDGGLKNNVYQFLRCQVFEQSRPAAAHLSQQTTHGLASRYPAIKCRPINSISCGNLALG